MNIYFYNQKFISPEEISQFGFISPEEISQFGFISPEEMFIKLYFKLLTDG